MFNPGAAMQGAENAWPVGHGLNTVGQFGSFMQRVCSFMQRVQRSETHQCGFVKSQGALRSAARTLLESQTHKLANRDGLSEES